MRRMLFMIALAALLMFGCGGATRSLQRGIESYDRTDYPSAMSQWSHITTSERSLSQRNRARYLVYRGLTHYRLGDHSSALSYLSRGKEALMRGNPGWVRADIAAEMDTALSELSGQPGEATQPPPPGTSPDLGSPGEALVPIKRPAVDAPLSKTDTTSASTGASTTDATNSGPGPDKTDVTSKSPASAKPAAPSARPTPAKTATGSAGPAPTKISSPATKTSPAVQSTSPK